MPGVKIDQKRWQVCPHCQQPVRQTKYYQVNFVNSHHVDEIHERAESERQMHLLGKLISAHSSMNCRVIYALAEKDIAISDR
jgi:NAD-dependent SIR2 family protein deacetylase